MKTDIKQKLVKFVWPLAIIFAITAFIVNAVFAATDLRIPVEIVWNDQGVDGGTRPSQVILHVRRSGSNENLKTVTLTSANVDPNDNNKWVTTIDGLSYNSSYTYQIYQDTVTGYNITQSANVSVTTQLGIVNYEHDTITDRSSHTYSDSDFFLFKRHNSQAYSLWSYIGYNQNTVTNLIRSEIDGNITIGNYETGYDNSPVNIAEAELTFESGYDEITVSMSKGGSYDVYYGKFDNIAQGSTVTLTDTLNVQTYNLTVHHLNEDGTAFAADTVTPYNSGATYTASPISNNRYTPELTIGQATGIINQDTEVTYVYHPKFHNVIYQFTGSAQPPNASQLLPATAEHEVGTTVTVAQNPTATGYRFLGWKIDGVDAGTSFTMPTSDVTITGSWEQFNGYFAPTISKQITNPQTVYRYGDTVEFQIYVTNTASFPITNVEVTEGLVGVNFLAASGYTVSNTGDVATIATIPANGTVVLYAEFPIAEDVTQTLTSTAEITAASASNYYYLDTSQSITASASFNTQSWQDVPVLTGVNTNSTTLYIILMAIGAIGIAGGVVVNQNNNKEREK